MQMPGLLLIDLLVMEIQKEKIYIRIQLIT